MGSWELGKKTARVAFEQSRPAWIAAGNHVSALSDSAVMSGSPAPRRRRNGVTVFLPGQAFMHTILNAYES